MFVSLDGIITVRITSAATRNSKQAIAFYPIEAYIPCSGHWRAGRYAKENVRTPRAATPVSSPQGARPLGTRFLHLRQIHRYNSGDSIGTWTTSLSNVNVAADLGPSNFDVRNSFSAAVSWQIPSLHWGPAGRCSVTWPNQLGQIRSRLDQSGGPAPSAFSVFSVRRNHVVESIDRLLDHLHG
jgi:hypothetical protein